MANRCKDLPVECWELIFSRLHHKSDLESFSMVSKQFLALTNRLRIGLSVIDSTLLTHGTISKLIHRFPNLKSIDLSNFSGDLDPVLVDLANSVSYTSNLEQLDISNHKKLPFKGLKELGRKLKGLRVLTCSNLTLFRDSDLYVIAELFPFLEELDISYPSTDYVLDSVYIASEASNLAVTDSGVEVLSVNMSNLRKINVSGNHLITDRSLVALSMNCLNLEGLEMDDCPFITLKGILSILRTCAALSWISVSEIHIAQSSSGFECLATSSRTLQKLEVSNSIITDEFLFMVANASLPLNTLTLCWCTDFTYSGISKLLCAYQSLKYLSLVQVDFLTDESMDDLSQYLRCLVTIDLSGCMRLTNLTFYALARNCPSLKEIYMENTGFGTKHCFHDDVKNPRIRSVNLATNHYLDDDSLMNVALMCPNMDFLDVISCTSLTEASIIGVLEVCNQIRDLQLDNCSGIKHIGKGAELPSLEVISAAGSALNDEGLVMIGSRCSRLLKLNLENCKGVTAEGLHAMVKNCRSLREINLKKCPQVSINSLNNLVFSSSSLRRVIPPCCSAFTDSLRGFYLHHGCRVYSG
ncbi:hypothetical protein KY290_018944 [Solanum tuberosum]|uniref:F-box/LRR-repeat protein n=2 Tax=Solanum tuberosum TaxID=4113 RepID=M1B3Y7_SOLTU|nr:PREDICTED: F-box/LRR-repeat protein 7-like [Solanum tuberosum]KAH0762871.1 hypothetical protein KY290_018944 [Solanum tuberosum]